MPRVTTIDSKDENGRIIVQPIITNGKPFIKGQAPLNHQPKALEGPRCTTSSQVPMKDDRHETREVRAFWE